MHRQRPVAPRPPARRQPPLRGAPAPEQPGGGANQETGAANAANPGKSSGTAATEALMQRMQQECGTMADVKARNACQDRYRQQMGQAGHLGSRFGQFQQNTESPDKPQ